MIGLPFAFSQKEVRILSNMSERNAVALEQSLNSRQQQSTDGAKGKRVESDSDPYAHLTPPERYALAIQRRDALLAARSRSPLASRNRS